ncbi:MAG: porin [Proteobacteria bacterium]|jgi:predicted porin|nr:porin [Pseudomonadota bacterium]MDD6546671.1 porin [Pseudomonadota bacterium]
MNKIKTAALITAAFVSAGAGAAEVYKTENASLSVYGRVKAEVLNGYGYQKISAKTDREDHPGFSLTSRLGVSGESKVNDFFSVFGNVIYDLNSEDGIDADDRLKIRFGYVGVRFGEYGELTAGHQLNAAYNALAHVDVFEHFGVAGNGASLDTYGVGAAVRQDGIIKFQEDNLNGFSYAVSYRFRDHGDNTKDGIAASFGYETPIGLGFVAGYQYNKAIDDTPVYKVDENNGLLKLAGVTGDRTEAIFGAYYGTFDKPGFYAAASYDHTRLNSPNGLSDDETSGNTAAGFNGDGFDAVVSYTTPGGAFTIGADWGYFKNNWANSDRDDAVNQITGIALWHVTDQAYGIIEYVDNFGDGEHRTAHQDWLSIGAVYNF